MFKTATNPFQPTDLDALRDALKPFAVKIVAGNRAPFSVRLEPIPMHPALPKIWPRNALNDEGDADLSKPFDFGLIVMPFVPVDFVLVVTELGHEARHPGSDVSGSQVAFIRLSTGEVLEYGQDEARFVADAQRAFAGARISLQPQESTDEAGWESAESDHAPVLSA